ncbi:MAG: hypothetical protein FWB88_06205 [Defluviitaleaceae bacterium]|nr:hypothetical protein [Defluviitaleaceae bacterium]MCL2238603.1 hypothetical protein [Defluviitaleaceae bacterium]
MTVRERFLSVLNFQKPDKLPKMEWAPWWDKTFARWRGEGLPACVDEGALHGYLGLERLECVGAGPIDWKLLPPAFHRAGILGTEEPEAVYEEIRPYLFTDRMIEGALAHAREIRDAHSRGDIAIRLWIDGCFWFPRSLFGIEQHLYAFYDHGELMHRMNGDLVAYNVRAMKAVFDILVPDMVGIAEDMSYNHGPMLSKGMFDEFIAPYYAGEIAFVQERGVKVWVDTDGDVGQLIPWLLEAGVAGVYPLERQAGVDIAALRREYPTFLMMGGYDKMVMSQGEGPMRAEFERLLPVMRTGGYIPSVDHQTPPEVSLDNYKIYVKLLDEYCAKACE